LSCCIEESKDERKLTMIQLHWLACLIQNFGEEIEGKRKFLTPGTPRFKIQRSTINMDVLDPQSQKKYRSGVSMLLYLTKILNQISVTSFNYFQNAWILRLGELTMNF
jgi:hypothetical protein